MYLRFYSQTDENIDKCIAEMRPRLTGLKQVTKGKITISTNPFLPPETGTLKNVEVILTFDTKENEQKAHDDRANFAIYQKYMTGSNIQGATAEMRRPGDIAYNNPTHGGGENPIVSFMGNGLVRMNISGGGAPRKLKPLPKQPPKTDEQEMIQDPDYLEI